jgi:hypothetical protein
MTSNRSRPDADHPEKSPQNTSAPSSNLEDLGSRAADLSADLYADLEREQRKQRFDRAVARSHR